MVVLGIELNGFMLTCWYNRKVLCTAQHGSLLKVEYVMSLLEGIDSIQYSTTWWY